METTRANGLVDADSVNAVFRGMALGRIEDLAKSLLNEFDPVKRRAGIEAIMSVAAAARREPDPVTRERLTESIRKARERTASVGASPEETPDSRNPDFVPRPTQRPTPGPAPDAIPRITKRAAPRYY